MASIVFGRNSHWKLGEQIGKGDAGEVLRVQTELGRTSGLMKRPVQNVSGGTIVRQAVQIENEGKVLAALNGLDARRKNLTVHTPLLLDQSPEGTSKTAALFIVSEEVRGVAISNLLKNLIQKNASFSQTLVLKVISSLFTLLAEVHARGIAWNDVKMEHIFWDESANTLSFIDWGNGLFFQLDEPMHPQHPVRLDYQQFITEGGLLLNQIAPELIPEIDWPSDASALTPEVLLQLQHRVEYMETHLSMRVKEYQLTFDKSSRQIDSLAELQDILELKQSLKKLGVEVQTQSALQSIQNFALRLARQKAYPDLHALIELLATYLPEGKNPNWQLADYLLSLEDAYDRPAFTDVLTRTIANDLPGAIWELEGARESSRDIPRLVSIQMAMRSAHGVPDFLADPLYNQLLEWQEHCLQQVQQIPSGKPLDEQESAAVQALITQLEKLTANWSQLAEGEMLGDKLLILRDLLQTHAAHLTYPPGSLPQALLRELASTREILTFWVEGELPKCREALVQFFLLEPTLPYLRGIAAQMDALQNWISQLSRGPRPGQSLNTFGRELMAQLPRIAQHLSQPAWLSSLIHCAENLASAADEETLRLQAANYQWPVPWLEYGDIKIEFDASPGSSAKLSSEQMETLSAFHQALRLEQDPSEALSALKARIPEYYGLYRLLALRYENLFSALPVQTQALDASLFPKADQENVLQTLNTIDNLEHWKETQLRAGAALETAPPETNQGWLASRYAREAQISWKTLIQPPLILIKQMRWDALSTFASENSLSPKLNSSAQALINLADIWAGLQEHGLFPENAREAVRLAEQAQADFFAFWQELENAASRPLRWLVQSNQAAFSGINQSLQQLLRHFQSLERALLALARPGTARSRLAWNSAGDMMFALGQIHTLLDPPARKATRIRLWQEQYNQILKQTEWKKAAELLETLDTTHPLASWFQELTSKDIDIFNEQPKQKW